MYKALIRSGWNSALIAGLESRHYYLLTSTYFITEYHMRVRQLCMKMGHSVQEQGLST